jgi:hypothetical protein
MMLKYRESYRPVSQRTLEKECQTVFDSDPATATPPACGSFTVEAAALRFKYNDIHVHFDGARQGPLTRRLPEADGDQGGAGNVANYSCIPLDWWTTCAFYQYFFFLPGCADLVVLKSRDCPCVAPTRPLRIVLRNKL